jgi:hypothetical protein
MSNPFGRNAADRIAELERKVADLLAWKAAVEAAMTPPLQEACEDGAPRKWLTLRDAEEASGRSIRGLRKLMRQKKLRARYRGPRPMIDITSIPVRRTG